MKLVHAHFPINVVVPKDGTSITIKNFLGGAQDKFVPMVGGTTVKVNPELKNEIIFEGIDNAALSMCCARVNQICRVGRKDLRKFLDGIYVSKKEVIQPKDM